MSHPMDTSAAAHATHIAVYRRFGGNKRLEVGLRMSDDGRALARAGIAARHPEYDSKQLHDAVALLYLGADLFQRVWPDRKLVTP